MKHLLILCPLPEELNALLARMRERGHQSKEVIVGPLKVLEFPDLQWRLCLAGHGKTQFGIQTQFLLDRYSDIEMVICAGSAGGLARQLSVFDVIVAEKTIEHDYKLRFVKRPEPEFAGDAAGMEKLSAISTNRFKVHFGAIASGDEDIIDQSRVAELIAQTGALGVAWEGAGGARASKFNSMPFLEVRGVTDTANNEAPVHFETNLKTAMANVCDLLLAGFGGKPGAADQSFPL
jgi:adenosylhomocysteine nucleosidase